MVEIPGGVFQMGSNRAVIMADGESPARSITIANFWLDVHEVSNAEFERFVKQTKYVTEVRRTI